MIWKQNENDGKRTVVYTRGKRVREEKGSGPINFNFAA
jgi:hypothetical protein